MGPIGQQPDPPRVIFYLGTRSRGPRGARASFRLIRP